MGWAVHPNKLLAESCLASRPAPHPRKQKWQHSLASGAPTQVIFAKSAGFATVRNFSCTTESPNTQDERARPVAFKTSEKCHWNLPQTLPPAPNSLQLSSQQLISPPFNIYKHVLLMSLLPFCTYCSCSYSQVCVYVFLPQLESELREKAWQTRVCAFCVQYCLDQDSYVNEASIMMTYPCPNPSMDNGLCSGTNVLH